MVITASDERARLYAPVMPQNRDEHEDYWYAMSSQLHADQARAAAFTFTAVVGDGQEHVCVLASDRDGGEEAWTARLIRSATEPPRIVSWVRGEPGGTLMFMQPGWRTARVPGLARPHAAGCAVSPYIKPIYRSYRRYIGFIWLSQGLRAGEKLLKPTHR